MTIDKAKELLVDWCKSQIGYHEGDNNRNKYATAADWDERLYGFSADNVPWCDVFVDAAFITCFGFDNARKMTFQYPNGYAACDLSATAYKNSGAFYMTPEVGDQIFFYAQGKINHTGIVVAVNEANKTIQCVEGNYSDSVAFTSYNIGNSKIAGYGRPDWSIVADEKGQDDIIHPDVERAYFHLAFGDGINNPLPQVKAWQNLLLCWGISVGNAGADGEFGIDTKEATERWQKKVKELDANIEVNGFVDGDDWKEIVREVI